MFKKIGSLRITLILLFILALSSMFGTVIAQHEADDFFNSSYYNLLLFCLGLNLLVCTVNSFKFVLLKDWRKMAIFLLHCGVLVVFAGALISRYTKQEQRYTLLPNEKIVLLDQGVEIVFKKLSIEYYPGGQIAKEYRSQIDLFDGGDFKKEYSLRVNHPLKYKGFSFYQSSFNVLADVEIEIFHHNKLLWKGLWAHAKPLQLKGENALNIKMTHFLPDVSVNKQGIIELRSYKLGNVAMLISVYRKEVMVHEQWVFPFNTDMTQTEGQTGIFDFKVKKITPVYETVIQSIRDPGLGFVMSGFALMFWGLIMLGVKKKA